MTARAIVIGAGLAGLSAAVRLREAGVTVAISEAAGQAGGRCRSYHDDTLGLTVDNGNHLVLSGNAAVARFRETIGAPAGTLAGPDHATFAFADLASGARWTVRPNDGAISWWLLVHRRRAPGSRARDYLPLLRLARAGAGDTLGNRVDTVGAAWERLLGPVLLAALNHDPRSSSARLAWAVLRETIARGGRAMRPLVASPTLAAAFVDPAVAWLAARGTSLRLHRRLRAIECAQDRVTALRWSDGSEDVAPDTAVVLATPAPVAATLVPGLIVPDRFRPIVNAHFSIAPPPGAPPMLGLLHAEAQWLFAFPDRISVTVSAADHLLDADEAALARTFWREIGRAYRWDAAIPRWRIVTERRATFAATPEQNRRRPPAATRWRNLFLAGDWTRTGLPATIEGAIRSGETAARLAIGVGGG